MTGQTVDRPFNSSPDAAQVELGARFQSALHHALLVFLLLLTFFPFFIAILTSLKSFQQLLVNFWLPAFPLQLHNYVMAWNEIYRSIINSSLVSLGAVTGVLLCASLAAYAFARIDFAWRDAAYYLVLSLLMIPGVLTLIGRYLLIVQFGLMNSLWGLILPYIAGGLAFAVFLLTGFFSDLPEELFEAARMDGGTELQMYRLIALPLSRPIMAIVGLLTFLSTWGDYVWPLLVLRSPEKFTLMLGLAKFTGNSQVMFGPLMAGYVIASIPTAIIIVLMMRTFAGAALVGAFK